ncbi:hypothetical protein M1615_01520 [Patescibacteria group bacterium]|nr:hypothetical protein [Patescibacteria group bacterium]MCL5010266.1 hypothetical protein [Patescibacteria group bacterium]
MVHSFAYCIEKIGEVGEITQTNEFLIRISGLSGAKIGEGVTFENETHGQVMALDRDGAWVLALSRSPLKSKTKAARTGVPLSISAGEGLLGHMINTLGHSLTTRRQKSFVPEKRAIEAPPLGIGQRSRISSFLETGISVVDLLLPLGFGQRELVIGDRQSGKTHFLLSTMLSQAKRGTVCIYAAIGKRKNAIKETDAFLLKKGVMDNCIIVAADSYASPGEVYLAPYTAMAIAEYFRDMGRDSLLILDDLTMHAKYYREIALLANSLPGRESYPGDIFHVQSKLMERAGSFLINGNQVTLTCLPVAESTGGDLTGYIQTNLMSMTDGHIYFDAEQYFAGRRPPINIFLSVTRVGRQTQSDLLRDTGYELLRLLKQYEYARRFMRFQTELSSDIREMISRGQNLTRFFNQIGYISVPVPVQIMIASLIWLGKIDKIDLEKTRLSLVKNYETKSGFREKLNRLMETASTFKEFRKLAQEGFPEFT